MASFVRILARALPLVVAIAAAPAMAQDYPSRPVTIVVGYTPGATSDLLARTVAERLNAAWGQSVIVDNRSGWAAISPPPMSRARRATATR